MAHPSSTKERLMNKILAQMMLHCKDRVTPAQVETLQTYKDTAADFDSSTEEYSKLLNFSLDHYKVSETASKEEQEAPIEMSQAEYMMQTVVEVCRMFINFDRTSPKK